MNFTNITPIVYTSSSSTLKVNLNNAYKGGVLRIDPAILIQNQVVDNLIQHSFNQLSDRFIELSKKIENATKYDAYKK